MTQDHKLHHLITLHIHQDLTDDLDLESCANGFVDKDKHRLTILEGSLMKTVEFQSYTINC